jgi:hypothetical protein
MKTSKVFFVLAAISLLVIAAFPGSTALAQDDTVKGCIPKVLSPIGTILDTTPAYSWGMIANATQYNYQVLQGAVVLHDETLDSAACGVDGCTSTPALTLDKAVYKWRVRAFVDGVWKNFSKLTYFTVSPAGFNNAFNGAMGSFAWKAGGTWSVTGGSYLHTEGIAEGWTSAYSTKGQYTDFDYSIRSRLAGDGTVFIAARMGKLVRSGSNEWYPGYRFGYCEGGEFAVIRINADGSRTPLQDWTVSGIINPHGWNTLRVVAKGSSLTFSINGTQVAAVTDTTFSRGFVGITTRREFAAPGYALDVDWAKLTVLETLP